MSVEELDARAWEIRRTVKSSIRRKQPNEHHRKIWEATLNDTDNGASMGPLYDESEVTQIVGTDNWCCIERNPVVQKNKTRGVDNASQNSPYSINDTQSVVELLQI